MSETTTPPAIEVHLPEPPLTKFERERQAFYRLLPELLTTHWGSTSPSTTSASWTAGRCARK